MHYVFGLPVCACVRSCVRLCGSCVRSLTETPVCRRLRPTASDGIIRVGVNIKGNGEGLESGLRLGLELGSFGYITIRVRLRLGLRAGQLSEMVVFWGGHAGVRGQWCARGLIPSNKVISQCTEPIKQ